MARIEFIAEQCKLLSTDDLWDLIMSILREIAVRLKEAKKVKDAKPS